MVYEQTVEIIDLINNHFNEAIPYPTSIVDLIPKLPSSIKNKDIADTLLDKVKNYRKSVLLCNGHVNSSQSPPFNLSERINNLVLTNPDCAFIYTTKERDAIAANEYFIDDYLPERPNIDEIRYISTFCDILVSKMSGPGSAICLHENFFDDKKTLICLTDYESLAYWYREGVCNYDWTNDYSEQSISNMISKYLNVTKE
jgi:hypothetical protein